MLWIMEMSIFSLKDDVLRKKVNYLIFSFILQNGYKSFMQNNWVGL